MYHIDIIASVGTNPPFLSARKAVHAESSLSRLSLSDAGREIRDWFYRTDGDRGTRYYDRRVRQHVRTPRGDRSGRGDCPRGFTPRFTALRGHLRRTARDSRRPRARSDAERGGHRDETPDRDRQLDQRGGIAIPTRDAGFGGVGGRTRTRRGVRQTDADGNVFEDELERIGYKGDTPAEPQRGYEAGLELQSSRGRTPRRTARTSAS